MRTTRPFSVEKITVHAKRMVLDVVCAPGFRMTTPDIARRACDLHPDLPRHACVNEAGPVFGSIIEHTPVPHLFEHVAVDILARGSERENAVFVGTSEWTDVDAGRARVELSFDDDLEALAAIKQAASVVCDVLEVSAGRDVVSGRAQISME